ncbi:pilus assembly FimT family protein [Thermodesulforhabdus norvegica]|uniref:General secretion pathway protein H n=1 Tax=Thermodesulforhabdus norvegica TaxID=39841 RepID=A0A1I4SRC3_9BACT|nr:type II secretion system protein [Thermodesulforhabdus norvegica]SFM67068.1 general secretion pathway protein H [Thermodesulforhabdus norvegica]
MKNRGFTLIEVILVVLIFSLAVGMVAPRIGGGALRMKERNFVTAMVESLLKSREKALASGKTEIFFIDSGERTFGVGQNAHGRIPENADIYAEGLEDLGNGRYAVRFFPDGTAPPVKLDVTFDRERQYIISVDPILNSVSWTEGTSS